MATVNLQQANSIQMICLRKIEQNQNPLLLFDEEHQGWAYLRTQQRAKLQQPATTHTGTSCACVSQEKKVAAQQLMILLSSGR
jgi:hypothetical protein